MAPTMDMYGEPVGLQGHPPRGSWVRRWRGDHARVGAQGLREASGEGALVVSSGSGDPGDGRVHGVVLVHAAPTIV